MPWSKESARAAAIIATGVVVVLVGIYVVSRPPDPGSSFRVPEPKSPGTTSPTEPPGQTPPAPAYVNHFCVHVERLGFKCPQLLAAPSILDRGAIVQLTRVDENPSDRVAIPTSWLLREPCLLPGAAAPSAPEPETTNAAIPTATYRFEGKLSAGLDLRIPRLQGLDIKAGPNVNRVRRIDVGTKKAWVLTLGEDALASLISSCSLRRSCVERVVKMRDRVVNNVLVAEGLEFGFYDDADRKLSIQASLKENLFSLGGTGGTVVAEDTRLISQAPVVIGVTFVRGEVVTSVIPCDKTAVFAIDGSTSVSVSGAGGTGSIPSQPTITKQFSEESVVTVKGREASECAEGFERTTSSANVRASVTKGTTDAEMRFTGDLELGGGHYATADGCVLGRPVGITGHDTGVTASVHWNGVIHALVRSETGAVLAISWKQLPEGATTTISGPTGEPVLQPFSVSGSGTKEIEIRAAGMHTVRTIIAVSRTANGAARESAKFDSFLSAAITVREPPKVTSRAESPSVTAGK